jgi:hypothetical protein
MPVSDVQTVASKVVMAAVVAPMLMMAAMIVGQILLLIATGLVVLAHGGSAWKLIWSHAHPFTMWGQFIVVQGVQALFLLPLFGWLMLASSFARGKPFLWATLPPVVFAILESSSIHHAFSINKVIWEFIRPLGIRLCACQHFGEQSMQAGFAGTVGKLQHVPATVQCRLWMVAIGLVFLAGQFAPLSR